MGQQSLRLGHSAVVERILGRDPEHAEYISPARLSSKVILVGLRWNHRVDTAQCVSGSVSQRGSFWRARKTQLTVSYGNPIAVLELPRLPEERFPVDPNAIDAVEILDGDSLGIHDELGMATRHQRVVKNNLAVRAPAYDEAPRRKPDFMLADVKLEASQRVIHSDLARPRVQPPVYSSLVVGLVE
jgi:hypothetical protein